MKKQEKKITIYQTKNGAIELSVDAKKDTIWASLQQIADLFNIDKSGISRHIKNIFKTKELERNSVVAKIATTASDGKIYQVDYYNLDMILSVGYRINSKQATNFRKWANKVLKEYLIRGYSINRRQIAKNYDTFMQTVVNIQNLLPENVTLDPKLILELIKEFSGTWAMIDAYDKNTLTSIGSTKKSIKLSGVELAEAITNFRSELIKKGEATELFAQEKNMGNVEGIMGNVLQSFGGKPVYTTAEEKAAHLLYFMVKNHPFNDGNKRSGAFAFVWFLRKVKIKGAKNINPSALTALTLLIAESHPSKKNQMVALVTTLLLVKR